MVNVRRPTAVVRYTATLPERAVRAVFAGVGGAAQETVALVLPRFVRRSRFYEATAKNALRIAVELVGGVEPGTNPDIEPEAPSAGRVAVKKGVGNVVEFGSIAAFGFSPLWLLAAASDILHGSRVYLRTLEQELANAGYLEEGVHFSSVDQLLGAFQGATGTTARAIDLPPIEIAELRQSNANLASDAKSLPKPGEMAALFNGLVRTARSEHRSLLEVSSGVGLAFFTSAKHVSREHVMAPYREDWQPLRREGFGAYAARISVPYRQAIGNHLHPAKKTWTEKAAEWVQRKARGGEPTGDA
jgi:hypothetical protein